MNASNYCAEFIEDKKHSQDAKLVTNFLKKAVKFQLPEGGLLIDVGKPDKDGYYRNDEIFPSYLSILKLPYDDVVLEYCNFRTKVLICALNHSDGDICYEVRVKPMDNNKGNHWYRMPIMGVVSSKDFLVRVKPRPSVNGDMARLTQDDTELFGRFGYVLLSFLAALECSNTLTIDRPASNLLNKKRIKKGKQPFFSYKVLTIDTKRDSRQVKGGHGTGGTKRVHLRRGHIRRLADKTVWVNPCVVGNKSKGMVTKDYRVI